MTTSTNVLGVDFGRVINDAANHPSGDDTAFLTGGYDQAMATPEMAGAAAALFRLSALFDGQIWVVSKCGSRIQELTQQWIRHHDFLSRAGIPPGNVRFCRRRPEKADHAAQLGITHFIDDRADVLARQNRRPPLPLRAHIPRRARRRHPSHRLGSGRKRNPPVLERITTARLVTAKRQPTVPVSTLRATG